MQEALQVRAESPDAYETLIESAMTADFSWDQSALAYRDLYRQAQNSQ